MDQEWIENIQRNFPGPMSEEDERVARDIDAFICTAIRNGVGGFVVFETLLHDAHAALRAEGRWTEGYASTDRVELSAAAPPSPAGLSAEELELLEGVRGVLAFVREQNIALAFGLSLVHHDAAEICVNGGLPLCAGFLPKCLAYRNFAPRAADRPLLLASEASSARVRSDAPATSRSAAFRLSALTLRGIGSYYEGARLEVKPLTILCGTNGSGKSTWIRALNVLRASHRNGLLPFSLADDLRGTDAKHHGLTNMLLAYDTKGRPGFDPAGEAHAKFGAPGTIGVELVALRDGALDQPARATYRASAQGKAVEQFLSAGQFKRGQRFVIRMAHPREYFDADEDDPPELRLRDVVELYCDQTLVLRLVGQGFGRSAPVDQPESRFTATSDLLDDPHLVALEKGVLRSANASSTVDGFLNSAVARIRSLLGNVLDECFHLEAMRPRQDSLESPIAPSDGDPLAVVPRAVGRYGEKTYSLLRDYRFTGMRTVERPEGGFSYIDQRVSRIKEGVVHRLLRALEDASSPIRRIWLRVAPEDRSRFLAATTNFQLSDLAKRAAEARTERSRDERSAEAARELATLGRRANWTVLRAELVDVLNSVLSDEGLYDPAHWPALPDEARKLVEFGVGDLNSYEVGRLNRLLIESAFDGFVPHRVGLDVNSFVSAWLQRLVDVRVYNALPLPAGASVPPATIEHLDPQPADESANDLSVTVDSWEEDQHEFPNSYNSKFLNDAWDTGAAPVSFSSGFHQVAPMLVQSALMARGELLCIENPEVHLHPSLQTRVTEFFVSQAAAGKSLLIETHSDLIVRRTLRAILQEELKQARVGINFVITVTSGAYLEGRRAATSRLVPMEINERGQIRNWPEGFMDEDIRESRRLMEAMYGGEDE